MKEQGEADVNYSQFDSEAELFNIFSLHYALQPTTLVNFQKNKMKCSLPNRGPAEENKRGLPFSHSVETLKGFISSPPKLMGPPSCAEHHARHWVKLMPHCPLGLGGATVLPGCPGLLGSSGPSRKAVLPENSELISLVL